MRLAHFGTFDIENYGDLLFPLVLAERLRHLTEEIVSVSPLGGPAVWGGAPSTIAVEEMLETESCAPVGGTSSPSRSAGRSTRTRSAGSTSVARRTSTSRHPSTTGVPLVPLAVSSTTTSARTWCTNSPRSVCRRA